MPWYGSIHSGKMPRWKSAFLTKRTSKAKQNRGKRRWRLTCKSEGIWQIETSKKGIRKCRLTIMLLCPTSFFLGYRKKESNSKRKRAVDCAGNNFLHGQKSTIAQLLSTTYSFYLITKSVLFCTQGLHWTWHGKKEITIHFEHKSATTQLYEELVYKTTMLFDMCDGNKVPYTLGRYI